MAGADHQRHHEQEGQAQDQPERQQRAPAAWPRCRWACPTRARARCGRARSAARRTPWWRRSAARTTLIRPATRPLSVSLALRDQPLHRDRALAADQAAQLRRRSRPAPPRARIPRRRWRSRSPAAAPARTSCSRRSPRPCWARNRRPRRDGLAEQIEQLLGVHHGGQRRHGNRHRRRHRSIKTQSAPSVRANAASASRRRSHSAQAAPCLPTRSWLELLREPFRCSSNIGRLVADRVDGLFQLLLGHIQLFRPRGTGGLDCRSMRSGPVALGAIGVGSFGMATGSLKVSVKEP